MNVPATRFDGSVVHMFALLEQRDIGWVAWCQCGIGSPPKQTEDEARASIAVHIVFAEFPK